MKFKEWFLLNERDAGAGRTNSRPSQQFFAANRGQLWGPSAQYLNPDSMLPGEKAAGAIVTGIGSSLARELRRDVSPQPQMLPIKFEPEPLVKTLMLPLQYSEDIRMSYSPYQKPRTLLYKVMPVFDVKKINFSGRPEQDKYTLLNIYGEDSYQQTNMAVNFTKGLIFNYLKLTFKNQSRKYTLDDPEVILEDRQDVDDISFLRLVVSYKRREIPKELEDKLSGKPAYGEDNPWDDMIQQIRQTPSSPLPPGVRGTSTIPSRN